MHKTMINRWTERSGWSRSVLAGVLALSVPTAAVAGRLILRIKAVNPIERSQVVQIKSNLPQGVSSNHVLSLDGLELGYDVRNDIYYVHREVPLGPKQVQTFDVEVEDIWRIDEEKLTELVTQAGNLTALLVGTDFHGTASAFQEQIGNLAERIRRTQKQNAISVGVAPIQHIAAYDANKKVLGRIRRDVGHIENLVLESGQDPGRLVGEDRKAIRLRRDIELPTDEYGKAAIQIVVRNTSSTEPRTITVRRPLPPEVGPDDVLDADGLAVTVDPESQTSYVVAEDLELAPAEEATFTVVIRDKWNINKPRIGALMNNASNLLVRLTDPEKFQSLEQTLTGIVEALDTIAAEEGPSELSPRYVAYYRDQARRVDELEQRINRVRSAMKPIEKDKPVGFPVKPPTMKTTWLIIYIILGFVGVLSLLFFLRWYGKTQDEKMWAEASKSGTSRSADETSPPPGA